MVGAAMAEPASFKYRAFISYSHGDTSWAKWLHRALEGFTIDRDLAGRETGNGPVPKALRPIFRDRDEFTAGHALSDQTLAALDASHAVIVICSPSSAKSRYVNEEVRLFKSRHPDRPVIPLIVAGTPGDPEAECFPAALKFKLDADGKITDEPVELLAADAREEGDGKSLALAKVVAGLIGVSSDDIFRRAMRERRRRQRNWIAGLSVVAISLAGLAVWAEINRREAVAQRTIAEEQKNVADERRQEAENNFAAAKQGAHSLVLETAQALRGQEGMRTETVRKILGIAEQVIGKLVEKSKDNPELLDLQATMLHEFAQTYAFQGDMTKANEAARNDIAIADRMARADPGNAGWQHALSVAYDQLGDVLQAQGDLAGALKSYQEALTIDDRQAKADPANTGWQRELSVAYAKIADVLHAQGNLAEALKSYRDSLAIGDRLAKADPTNADSQSDLSVSYQRVGEVLQAQGDLDGALKAYQDSFAIADRLARGDPSNTGWQDGLSVLYIALGDVLQAQGKLAEALKSYQDGLAIADRLAKADPGNADRQRGLFSYYNRFGDLLRAQGNLAGALKSYEDSLAIIDRLAKADPSNTIWQRELSVSYANVGDLLQAQGSGVEALKSFQDGLAIADRLAKSDPGNADWQRHLAMIYARIAVAFVHQGRVKEALEQFTQGRAIIVGLMAKSPDNAQLPKDLAGFDDAIGKLEGGPSRRGPQ
jgi:tetratricopeptide (TPR) repeat protein